MKFEIKQSNYQGLLSLANIAKQSKADKLEIEMTDDISKMPKFSEIVEYIYPVLDYEAYFEVWLKNFPYCVLTPEAVDHILSDDKKEKIKDCQACLWFEQCPGFSNNYLEKYKGKEICPMPDLPWEVMIEVEPGCNFNCQFCFNKISFAKDGRKIKSFSTDYVKKIISSIAQLGIKIVRFTGGEPLLRKDIFQLIKYAKDKELETRLNTNGLLINQEMIKKFGKALDNVLVSIDDCSNSLDKKIKAIKLLKKEEIPVVRVGTVATKENILNFDKIAELICDLSIDEWEFYRPIPINKKEELDSKLVNLLVEKIIDLRRETAKAVFIANALPFCAIKDLNKINSVSKGGLFDDGHTRLVVDPRNFVKPHYFIDENIGQPLDILKAWQGPFMKKMRNLEYLPEKCHNCNFVFKCRGGSRQIAKMVHGEYNKMDPLMRI
tara:strand:+ start:1 stop:1308 length:1308 start_codon:yes stop_codon:yes gene_type:complete